MNDGIYGFPPGKNITVDFQEFTESGIWYKPKNAKFCFMVGCGGGGAGFQGTTNPALNIGGRGGGGAPGLQIVMWDLSTLKPTETVLIGAGGKGGNGAYGGDTIFRGHSGGGYMYFAGGIFDSGTNNRNCYMGGAFVNNYSGGGAASTTSTTALPGYHGNFGAGGGGAGGANTGGVENAVRNGGAGGRPRSFSTSTGAAAAGMAVTQGGGASGGITFGADLNGYDAVLGNCIDGFGEGGGGGAANSTGTGGRGGNGIRGSGGGGGGAGTGGQGGLGGDGGDGYLQIITYCWE